ASDFSSVYQSGNISAALNTVDKEAAANATSKDAVLWRLEQGATLRTAALADPGAVPAIAAPVTPPQAGEAPTAEAPVTPADISNAYLKQSLLSYDKAEEKVNDYEAEAKVKMG